MKPSTPRGPSKPVPAPEVRWLGEGLLDINGKSYAVEPIYADRGDVLLGYRLRTEDGDVYDIDLQAQTCDCADATFRQRRCKHLQGLAIALESLTEDGQRAELEQHLDKVERDLDFTALLEWAAMSLKWVPNYCFCLDGSCQRCQVERIVAKSQKESGR